MQTQPVITVDLDNPTESLKNLAQAFAVGTFMLKNPPIDFKKMSKVLADLNQFYELDVETKIHSSGQTVGSGATRGYFPIGAESGSADAFEKKESYAFGWPDSDIPEAAAANLSLVAANHYPTEGYINREEVESVIKDFAATTKQLIKMIETILLDDQRVLPVDASSDYQSLLRSFRYYKKTELDPVNTVHNSLHSDWNLITLVYTDADGFQYRDDDGHFQNMIPETAESLIVNFGDFLSSWTHGKIVSPWHRVIEAKQKAVRNSLVFFYYPAASSPAVKEVIYHQGEPLGLFIDQSQPAKQLWDYSHIETMNEMYAEKWKQVNRV